LVFHSANGGKKGNSFEEKKIEAIQLLRFLMILLGISDEKGFRMVINQNE